jgi:hypothetical protein
MPPSGTRAGAGCARTPGGSATRRRGGKGGKLTQRKGKGKVKPKAPQPPPPPPPEKEEPVVPSAAALAARNKLIKGVLKTKARKEAQVPSASGVGNCWS